MSDVTIPKLPALSSATPTPSKEPQATSAQITSNNIERSSLQSAASVGQTAEYDASPSSIGATKGEATGSNVSGAQLSSNIMTYRDGESGRLVVRLVDNNNNAIISEFPSKTMLGNYPKQDSLPSTTSLGLDTKA